MASFNSKPRLAKHFNGINWLMLIFVTIWATVAILLGRVLNIVLVTVSNDPFRTDVLSSIMGLYLTAKIALPKYSRYFTLERKSKSEFSASKRFASFWTLARSSRRDAVLAIKHDLITNVLPRFFMTTRPGTKLSVKTHLIKEFEIERLPYGPQVTEYVPRRHEKAVVIFTAKAANLVKKVIPCKGRNDLSDVREIKNRKWYLITWTNRGDLKNILEQQLSQIVDNKTSRYLR